MHKRILNTGKTSLMRKMIGKKFSITGMAIEIVAEDGDKWETRNITTGETVFISKSLLRDAIKLGKAEEITDMEDKG